MTQDQWTRFWKIVATIATALSVLAATLAGISISINNAQQAEIDQLQTVAATDELTARGANTKIYFSQGGSALTFANGSSLTADAGANLTVDSITVTNLISQQLDFAGINAAFSGDVTGGTLAIGGGYGSTGCSVSGAGVLTCNGAATTDGALTAGSAVIGGGYGGTGCTLSAAGVLQCNGAATVDGAAALDGGITVDTTNFTVDGTTGAVTTASSATVGGGYGSTGCTFSAAGVLQCNGAATTDGALTADSVVAGGGYGSTGCTMSTAGVLQCNGAATFDGATTSTGALAANGGLTFAGNASGPAEGNVVVNAYVRTSAAEIDAGHILITVPATDAFRLVDIKATAYGGACGAVTTVDIKAGAVFLATYAQANLTQSTLLDMTATGVTLLADGASFVAQPDGVDITVDNTGSNVTVCTGVDFVISYILQ